MAISVVAGSAVGASSSTSITKPTSSGYVETTNDLIVVMCESSGNLGTNLPSLPVGFTSLGSINTNNGASTIWGWKLDSGSETWPKSFTAATGSGFDVWSCVILRGQDTITPTDGTATTAQISSGSALSLGAITASLAGDTLVILISDASDVDVTTWPSGVTEYADASNPVGNGVMAGTLASLASGSTGTLSVTMGATPGLVQACALLVKAPAAGGGGAAPSFTIGSPRGQGMSAPWRTTQRIPLTLYAHNAFTGISESDAMFGAREQFFGDGSQLALPLRPAYGQWPAAGFAGMGRTSLLWRSHNSGTGIAENDLTSVPTGLASEFYSVLWQSGIIPSGPITFAGNSALAESAQVVEPVAPLVGTSVLAETAAQVVTPAVLQAQSALVESVAQVAAPATVQANSALVETAAQVRAPATVQANSLLTETAQIVEPTAPTQSNSLLAESAQVVEAAAANVQANSALALPTAQVVDPSLPFVSNSLLAVTGGLAGQGGGTLISNSTLVETAAQVVAPATVQSTSVLAETARVSAPVTVQSASVLQATAAQVVAPAVMQSTSVLSVIGSSIAGGGGPSGPTRIVVSDAPLWATALTDAPVWATALTDAPLAATGLGDTATSATSVADAALAQTVLVDA